MTICEVCNTRQIHFTNFSLFLIYFSLFTVHCSLIVPAMVQAQGVEAPNLRSFKPDTTLPKVNVPEFVITGKAQIELPSPEKQSIEIDSSYFQKQDIHGLGIDVPLNSLSGLNIKGSGRPSLFTRLSLGTYTTTNYLLGGSGNVSGYDLHGSLSGNYTSGFIPYTINRNFSIQAGAAKGYMVGDETQATNSIDAAYSHQGYFLYGGSQPNLIRTINHVTAEAASDLCVSEVPIEAKLGFDRFSMNDFWLGVQSALKLQILSRIDLSSGSVDADGTLRFGNHSISYKTLTGMAADSVDESFYNFAVGANYDNIIGNLWYSLGLRYYQYEDDSLNGIAKLFPDLRASYNVTDVLNLFTRFHGTIGEPDLSGIVTISHYVDGMLPMMDSQEYADFVFGGRVTATNELTIIPQISIKGGRYYPIFISDSLNDNHLHYANRATIFATSIEAEYKKDQFSGSAVLNIRGGTADPLSSIPNFAPFNMNVNADYAITPRFTVSGSLLVLSARYSDLSLRNKLGASWLLGVRLAYDLDAGQIPIEVFAEGKNLLNQKYYIWQGYQEFPITISIGVSSKIL